jgi:ferritin-like protein
MAGESLHEERGILGPEILDRHRAIATLMEELEAIDWYDQRIKASDNAELRAILSHNRNEEAEHASMLLEWLRRHDAGLDQQLRKYLFTEGPIRDAAEGASVAGETADQASGTTNDLAIGDLHAARGS